MVGGEGPRAALARWREWIARISDDLTRSLSYQRTWREVARLWGFNRAIDVSTDIPNWIQQSHADSLVSAIRREVDRDSRNISLWNLLSELERKARYVTLADYVKDHSRNAHDREMRREEARGWLEPGTEHLDPSIPATDLAELADDTTLVREYVNRAVAHRGRDRPVAPTFADVSRAFGRIETIAQRYNLILRSQSYSTFESYRQFDHTLFVRRAWSGPKWKRRRWPDGFVERVGEFRETFDVLSREDFFRLWRARHQVLAEFMEGWQWEDHSSSPIRQRLESLGLPTSDAAVLWVRDRLLQQDT